jgi:hypothetical protein
MISKKKDELSIDNEICAELYNTLVTNYLHQDYLIWTRIELVAVFQASVLTTGLALRAYWFGPAAMFIGGIFTILLYLFISRTFDNRNVNLELTWG